MRRGLLPLIAVLGFGLLYVVVTPRGDDPNLGLGFFERDPKVAAATRRVTATADTLRAYQLVADRDEVAARLAALSAPTAPISVVADPRIPLGYANSLRDALAAELAGVEMRVPLRLVIIRDSLRMREAVAHYVRPQSEGEPCTIVRQLYDQPNRNDTYLPRREWRLVGVCGFYARYGMPGAGMTRWLDATGANAAMVDSTTPRERRPGSGGDGEIVAGAAVIHLAAVLACASGVDDACLDALNLEATRRAAPLLGAGRLPHIWRQRAITWDDFPSNALAHLRQELGHERFAGIWSSALRPDSAYTAVTGEPFAAFARPYVQLWTPPRGRGAMRAGLPILLSLGLLVSLAWWATARTPRMRS